LKFIEPKNKRDYESIKKEVAIMMLCKSNFGIIKCVDAYDYFEKLWIFLELMDIGAITECLQDMKGNIKENVCKYILHQALEGVYFLHSRGILHRDIKSDNILVNTDGEIKLADFGYATQLTKDKRGTVSQVGTFCWMAPELIQVVKQYD
jgi:serine/threonine protein kinase